ncbi:uncharacterized protein LOC142984960 [Anticarsia gemmatalis]|uniref:uncharacterized protein LOC142984960 n=1 Tax=Anticarsia gemmatalis TaxID=129554 RepID=UPI003F75F8A6
MAAAGDNKKTVCPPRTKPNYDTVDEATSKQIAENFRVIPMFEKGMFDMVYKRHYSLDRNENLKCAWAEYKRNVEKKVYSPFQFPDDRDVHFYNCGIRFLPSESLHTKPTFRNSLKPGPGVDYGGQMPIPQELHYKRTSGTKRPKKLMKGKKPPPPNEKTEKAE